MTTHFEVTVTVTDYRGQESTITRRVDAPGDNLNQSAMPSVIGAFATQVAQSALVAANS